MCVWNITYNKDLYRENYWDLFSVFNDNYTEIFILSIYFFLPQDAQDAYLEQQREITLTKKILVIQKSVRSWHYRRRFLKMRQAVVTVQTSLRTFRDRRRFIVVSCMAEISVSLKQWEKNEF